MVGKTENGAHLQISLMQVNFQTETKACFTDPTSGYRKPAPTLARTSRIGRVKPVGAPFNDGSCENDKWVLAMQIGRSLKP